MFRVSQCQEEQITSARVGDEPRSLLRVNFGDCPFYRMETEALKGQDTHSQIKNVSVGV